MVSVCTVPARGGRSCEHFGGYKTIKPNTFTFTKCPVYKDFSKTVRMYFGCYRHEED